MNTWWLPEISQRLERLGIFERLERDGPINLEVTEEEFELLRRAMQHLWTQSSSGWNSTQNRIVLAFFRAYTFYRELSENENRFWVGVQEEIRVPHGAVQASQRRAIWTVFAIHPEVASHRKQDGRGNLIVETIDAVWGIGRLRPSELERFFITAYRAFPGAPITPELMRAILPDLDEATRRQASAYQHVFGAMTQIVNFILDQDVSASTPLEALETMLTASGVSLGQPNALRFFQNKSDQALSRIIAALRNQRNEAQFRQYLESVKLHRFRLPDRSLEVAGRLARRQNLDFGRYRDEIRKQEQILTPSARISLDALERVPFDRFVSLAGLSVFVSHAPFEVQIGTNLESSHRAYLTTGLCYVWVGSALRGIPIQVNDQVSPASVGAKAQITYRLSHEAEHVLMAEIQMNTFFPERSTPIELLITGENGSRRFRFDPVVVAQRTTITLEWGHRLTFMIEGEEIEVLEANRTWLFTEGGRAISRSNVKYGGRRYWFVSTTVPALEGARFHEQLAPGFGLYEITWDGQAPLELPPYRIEERREARLERKQRRQERSRKDVQIQLAHGVFEAGEPIHLEFAESPPSGTTCVVGGHEFPVRANLVFIDALEPGFYPLELLNNGDSFGSLESIMVLPKLRWQPTRGTEIPRFWWTRASSNRVVDLELGWTLKAQARV